MINIVTNFLNQFSWIMNMTDNKIMKYAKIAIGLHVGINFYELIMVRVFSSNSLSLGEGLHYVNDHRR